MRTSKTLSNNEKIFESYLLVKDVHQPVSIAKVRTSFSKQSVILPCLLPHFYRKIVSLPAHYYYMTKTICSPCSGKAAAKENEVEVDS